MRADVPGSDVILTDSQSLQTYNIYALTSTMRYKCNEANHDEVQM